MASTNGDGLRLQNTRCEWPCRVRRVRNLTHNSITQEIYKNLHDNGLFRLETSDQTYCEDDKLFLADRFVEGTCPACGYDDARGDQCDKCSLTYSSPTSLLHPRCKRNKNHKVSVRPSTHACVRLDTLQPRLEDWMQKARVKGNWGSNAVITDKGEIIEPRMLGDGLRPSAVTRDLKWGVEVPKVGDKEADDAMEGKVICQSFCGLLSVCTDPQMSGSTLLSATHRSLRPTRINGRNGG